VNNIVQEELIMKRFFLLVSVMLILCVSHVFAGGRQGSGQTGQTAAGYTPINGGKPVTLPIEFHGLTPTLNTVPTAENPKVVLMTQRIADNFMKIHPNVKIEWIRTKPENDGPEAIQWFVTQIAAGTAPAIAYTWNARWAERDWYYDLTSVLETPNEYLPGNAHWKDIFPDYIWNKSNMINANRRIIGIPVYLEPGLNMAMFYNKDIFSKLNLKIPTNWAEMRNVCLALKAAGYASLVPWSGLQGIGARIWALSDCIGPGYAAYLFDKTDYDHNGEVTLVEQARATKDNIYNPVMQEYAREVLAFIKDMYNVMYTDGFESVDISGLWNSGTLGLKEDGMWEFAVEASNTRRSFNFDVFPFPIVTTASSKFVKDVEYTKSGPYQPNGHSFNLIKPVVEKDKGVEEAAIAWMKYFTVPENLNAAILEMGTQLPAIKDGVIPPLLDGWLSNSFPIYPNVPAPSRWPVTYTTDAGLSMGKELEMWVKGQTADTIFFQRWNELQQKSANDYLVANGINTTGW
jgi:ABC-type glycerol-3-phosphate transport system substrate-binding protein